MKKLLLALMVLVAIGIVFRVSRFSVPKLFLPQKDIDRRWTPATGETDPA